MKKLFWLVPLFFLLTGCYNYRELNDLSIVSAINVSKEKELYRVLVQVINPQKEQDASSSNKPKFTIYEGYGSSIQEALRVVVKEAPKKLYATQMQLLIIEEGLAESDLSQILDFFARNPEVRNEIYVLISQDEDLLEVLTPLDNLSSQNIMDSLDSTSKYLGYSNIVTFSDLLSNYQNDKIELTLPSIELVGSAKEGGDVDNLQESRSDSSIKLSNIGVFKDNKLVGFLDEYESLGFNLIMNKVTNAIVNLDYDNNKYIVTELIKVSSSVSATPKENKISINIKGKGAIVEAYSDIDLTKEKNILKIQNKLNSYIEELVNDTIDRTFLEFESDIFGFEDLFYKTDYKYYETIKDKWYEEVIDKLQVTVKSDVKIVEQGNLLGGLKNE